MRAGWRAGIAIAAVAALGAAVPGSAPAAKQCVFQSIPASKKNLPKIERSLLCLTNLHRLRKGRKPLLRDTRLARAARAHSADMASRLFFSHTTPEGITFDQRAKNAGYPFHSLSENLASSARTPTALRLFTQWRKSRIGHNQNMLSSRWKAAGMGIDPRFVITGARGITGTQMFGAPSWNTKDDGLDYYASSRKCANVKRALINKRTARKRAGEKGKKGKARRLGQQISQLKPRVKKHCEAPPRR